MHISEIEEKQQQSDDRSIRRETKKNQQHEMRTKVELSR